MKICDYHMYHGAALIQVAEDERFTAINSLKTGTELHHNAYKINDEIVLFLKYASDIKPPHNEYLFTFTREHLKALKEIYKTNPSTFIAMVCVGDREICCLSYEELDNLIDSREAEKGSKENQYTILVTVHSGESMRVYVNSPGVKNTMVGESMVVKRNGFPSKIFG